VINLGPKLLMLQAHSIHIQNVANSQQVTVVLHSLHCPAPFSFIRNTYMCFWFFSMYPALKALDSGVACQCYWRSTIPVRAVFLLLDLCCQAVDNKNTSQWMHVESQRYRYTQLHLCNRSLSSHGYRSTLVSN
jgi:hypothetical protein